MKKMYYVFDNEIQSFNVFTKEEYFKLFEKKLVDAYLRGHDIMDLYLFESGSYNKDSNKDSKTQLAENCEYLRSIKDLVDNDTLSSLHSRNLDYYFRTGQKEKVIEALNEKFQFFNTREEAVAELKRKKYVQSHQLSNHFLKLYIASHQKSVFPYTWPAYIHPAKFATSRILSVSIF